MTELTSDHEPENDEKWIGRLDLTPDIAASLGNYLAQITGFELILNKYLGILARIPDEESVKIIFGQVMSVGNRIEIISALADAENNRHFQPRLDELISEARAINSCRNEYVHGTYRTSLPSKSVELITWVTATSRKSKVRIVTAETVDREITKIRNFLGETMFFFHPNLELPEV